MAPAGGIEPTYLPTDLVWRSNDELSENKKSNNKNWKDYFSRVAITLTPNSCQG